MNDHELVYNVFEALECENSDLLLAKAQLSVRLLQAIQASGLDDTAAAGRIGITPERLGQFRANELEEFPLEELFDMLTALGQDVSIMVEPAADSTAHLRVAGIG